MSMTYNSLVSQVEAYLDRTDASTIAQIPGFILNAEQRIARESKNIGLEQYISGNFIVGLSVMPKPARWRRTLSLNFGNGAGNNVHNQLFLRSYEFLRNYWPNPTLTDAPKFYSDYGYNNILIAPTPDVAYPFEWSYLELPAALTLTNQTNWLTNYAPDVLLYATLLEAIPYLKDDERIPVWTGMYERGLKSLNDQDDQRILDRASNRGSD